MNRTYENTRSNYDGAKAPPVPNFLKELARRCLEVANRMRGRPFEPIEPNICLCNFYSQTGSIGLHQVSRSLFCSLNVGILGSRRGRRKLKTTNSRHFFFDWCSWRVHFQSNKVFRLRTIHSSRIWRCFNLWRSFSYDLPRNSQNLSSIHASRTERHDGDASWTTQPYSTSVYSKLNTSV